MRPITKIITFLIILILTLAGFALDRKPTREAKIWIGGAPMDEYLMEIDSRGIVKYKSSSVIDVYNEGKINGATFERTIRLSNKNRMLANDLIEKITNGESKEVSGASDIICIIALIDGKMYHSKYYISGMTDKWWYDRNVAELCYMLVKQAPFKLCNGLNKELIPDKEYLDWLYD